MLPATHWTSSRIGLSWVWSTVRTDEREAASDATSPAKVISPENAWLPYEPPGGAGGGEGGAEGGGGVGGGDGGGEGGDGGGGDGGGDGGGGDGGG